MNFSERNRPLFDIVCRCLGDNWRINLLDNYGCRIKVTSNQFMGFSIYVREDKNRFTVIGSFDSRIHRGKNYSCTVSKDRNPVHIADDIKRKIIAFAHDEITAAKESEKKAQDLKEQDKIVKGMLSQLLSIHSYPNSGVVGGFRACNGIDGMIRVNYTGYKIEICGLSVDNLIKIAGFIRQL
ncbi:hypothetical protein FAP59_16670 [Morganella morganii]|nr:hypothetical protein [Morganella morganii]